MIKIAIVDDDKKQTADLEKILRRKYDEGKIDYEIDIYFDGASIIKAFSQGKRYDVIFLDIKMEKVDGLDTARIIRKKDDIALIVYISSHEEYMKELFEVHPYRFLSKPIDEKLLENCCMTAFERVSNNNAQLYFKCKKNNEEKKILLKNIVFFESNLRKIIVHLNDGSYEVFYGKLNKIEKELKINNDGYTRFIRIHQSYLINYAYVTKMTFNEAIIHYKNELVALSISKDRKSLVRNELCEIAGGKSLIP
ncbi:MAG: LytTR family DNA-binding domain-containing protein [Pseudobutyrivibrio sp.]|nr:LytTR family DNA-binding domain-containing protein [Pseudobutyrivibrio sp.]